MNRRGVFGGIRIAFLLAASACAMSQPLDWHNDVTVFGTTRNEIAPALAVLPVSGEIRAWCVCDETRLAGKLSLNGGTTWSGAENWESSGLVRMSACSDEQFAYLLSWISSNGDRTLWRFSPRENSWDSANRITVAPDRMRPTYAACIVTDCEFQSADPYLNVCWVDSGGSVGVVQGWFAQSRDQGLTVRAEQMIFTGRVVEMEFAHVSMATAWNNDRERMFIATTLDRPGSIPHQIRLYVSEDEGDSWTDTTVVDATTFDQTEPSIAASGEFVLVAFVRRTIAGQQGDIFYSYSIDGGSTFTLPQAVAAGQMHEHSPRAVVAGELGTFSILYIAETDSSGGTVYAREGWILSPDELSPVTMVSGAGEVEGQGGLAVAVGPLGVAAMWTRRFPLGDTDVCFDASWRSASTAIQSVPLETGIISCYPNPFNGRTTLQISVVHPRQMDIEIMDILGRRVELVSVGMFPAGIHAVSLDLRESASGVYFVRELESAISPRRIVLMR